MLAAPVFAALDKKLGRRRQRVVGRPERRNLAVMAIIDAEMKPDFRHPLRVTHRAGPGADHLGGCTPAILDDRERVDQFLFPVAAAMRLGPASVASEGKTGRM